MKLDMGKEEIKPKVSVIVATYNQEDTLGASLDSILAQQCDFPFEIELADDCSTDGTRRVCEEYVRRYPGIIRYTRNEKNLGCRDNYFDTLLRCRAPYIADLAGDDIWIDPTKLARQVEVLDSNPEVTLVHTGWQYMDAVSGTVTPSGYTGTEKWLRQEIEGSELLEPLVASVDAMAVHSCTTLYRKEVFMRAYASDKMLFRSSEYPCEDLQLMVALAAAGRVAYLPEVTLNYRVGNRAQITSPADSAKAFRFYFGTLKLRRYLQKKYGLSSGMVDYANTVLASYVSSRAFAAADSEGIACLSTFCRANGIAIPLRTRRKSLLRHTGPLFRFLSKRWR